MQKLSISMLYLKAVLSELYSHKGDAAVIININFVTTVNYSLITLTMTYSQDIFSTCFIEDALSQDMWYAVDRYLVV